MTRTRIIELADIKPTASMSEAERQAFACGFAAYQQDYWQKNPVNAVALDIELSICRTAVERAACDSGATVGYYNLRILRRHKDDIQF